MAQRPAWSAWSACELPIPCGTANLVVIRSFTLFVYNPGLVKQSVLLPFVPLALFRVSIFQLLKLRLKTKLVGTARSAGPARKDLLAQLFSSFTVRSIESVDFFVVKELDCIIIFLSVSVPYIVLYFFIFLLQDWLPKDRASKRVQMLLWEARQSCTRPLVGTSHLRRKMWASFARRLWSRVCVVMPSRTMPNVSSATEVSVRQISKRHAFHLISPKKWVETKVFTIPLTMTIPLPFLPSKTETATHM